MFRRVEVLSAKRHGTSRLKALDPVDFSGGLLSSLTVPTFLSETLRALPDLPLVFTGENPPDIVALCGLGGGQSLLVDDGSEWAVAYLPAVLRSYPFALSEAREDGQKVVVVDPDSARLSQTDGEALYDEEGNRMPVLEGQIRLLEAIEQERQREAPLLQSLADSGVLVARELTLGEGDEQRTLARGFRVVDRDRLNALDDATLADWARKGLMGALEAHLASLKHLERLAERALDREGAASA